jgi:hypothetical protein
MKRILLLMMMILIIAGIDAQQTDTTSNFYQNSAEKLLQTSGKLVIGGYGEVHYHQPFNSKMRSNGSLDVHRLVMLLGYNFNSRTQFVSELEFEHVSEIYVEQAFLQHKLHKNINLRAGLLLIPMGIINEYHEPTTFNGVERPLIDNKIAPTTWREIGFGLSGTILEASLKYQAYVVNGFNGYNGKGNLNGKNGFRSGRQKGAESFMSSPNYTAKVEYYGIRGLNLGLSGYFGKTQSTLYNGIEKSNETAMASADSSVVGISMIGVDARYSTGGFHLKGQLYYSGVSNTDKYNKITKLNNVSNDLGSAMIGYYVEAGYNILRNFSQTNHELIPFVRLEKYDTHQKTDVSLARNDAYNNNVITTGLTWKLNQSAVLKTDVQFVKSKASDQYSKVFSAGVGVMF